MERVAPGFDASASKLVTHHDFRPDINGLRALAVLSVLAFHAGLGFAPGGFAGVDIFFVISGYLISRIILSERDAGAFSLIGFYGKRVKRILPALLVVLYGGWIAGCLLLDPTEMRRFGGHMEASSYFSVNLWLFRQSNGPAGYFQPNARYFPLLHLWSLSIEEQFYLIWPAMLLLLFRARRLLAPAIGLIFVASLAFCLYQTEVNSTAAFYSLSTRAWELALGAILARREVFSAPPLASPRAKNFSAALGIFLMLAAVACFSEAAPWPGSLALVPTLGCALVIAAPGAWISRILLGNRVAQFFGLISYPLYLWHWPLFSIAHIRVGDHLSLGLTALLLALSTLLAFLTWRLLERPLAAAYIRRPVATAAPLLAGLALAGAVGSLTRQSNGLPQRFPAEARAAFGYGSSGVGSSAQAACVENRVQEHDPLEVARRKARAFFADRNCVKRDDPDKPTFVVVGDSHAQHLLVGLQSVYGGRANIVMLGALVCAPLIAKTDTSDKSQWVSHATGSPRCQAINEEIVRLIGALKPAGLIVGAYFEEFFDTSVRSYPEFLKDFDANVATLRLAGVQAPILVMGQVPTWSPSVPILVGRELLAGRGASEFSREDLTAESLEIDRRLAAHPWGENVFYISQASKLCGDQGCRRFVGPRVPEDMIAFDYGHYTAAGSIYAVKNFLRPALDPALAANGAR